MTAKHDEYQHHLQLNQHKNVSAPTQRIDLASPTAAATQNEKKLVFVAVLFSVFFLCFSAFSVIPFLPVWYWLSHQQFDCP